MAVTARESPISPSADNACRRTSGSESFSASIEPRHGARVADLAERRGGLSPDAGVAVLERADEAVNRAFARALSRRQRRTLGDADDHSSDGWSMTAVKPMKIALVFNRCEQTRSKGVMRISC